MGRGRLAILYFALSLAAFLFGFALMYCGIIPPAIFEGIDPLYISRVLPVGIAIAGLIQALKIQKSPLDRPWFSRWHVALTCPAIIALAIAALVGFFILQPLNIPAASNQPSLMVGDYVMVSDTNGPKQ